MYGGFGVQLKGVCRGVSIWTKDGGSLSQKFGCLSGLLDCLGPALLTGKECLLSVLDYLGPAAETVLSVCRACWTIWVWPC